MIETLKPEAGRRYRYCDEPRASGRLRRAGPGPSGRRGGREISPDRESTMGRSRRSAPLPRVPSGRGLGLPEDLDNLGGSGKCNALAGQADLPGWGWCHPAGLPARCAAGASLSPSAAVRRAVGGAAPSSAGRRDATSPPRGGEGSRPPFVSGSSGPPRSPVTPRHLRTTSTQLCPCRRRGRSTPRFAGCSCRSRRGHGGHLHVRPRAPRTSRRSNRQGGSTRDLPGRRRFVVRGARGVQDEPARGPRTPHRTVATRSPSAPLDTTRTTLRTASARKGQDGRCRS